MSVLWILKLFRFIFWKESKYEVWLFCYYQRLLYCTILICVCLGKVVSGYRVRDGQWTLIGRQSPQLPQVRDCQLNAFLGTALGMLTMLSFREIFLMNSPKILYTLLWSCSSLQLPTNPPDLPTHPTSSSRFSCFVVFAFVLLWSSVYVAGCSSEWTLRRNVVNLTRCHTVKENKVSYQQPPNDSSFSAGGGTSHLPLPPAFWDSLSFELAQVFFHAVISYEQLPCCVQKGLFPWSRPPPLAGSHNLLPSLLMWSAVI